MQWGKKKTSAYPVVPAESTLNDQRATVIIVDHPRVQVLKVSQSCDLMF